MQKYRYELTLHTDNMEELNLAVGRYISYFPAIYVTSENLELSELGWPILEVELHCTEAEFKTFIGTLRQLEPKSIVILEYSQTLMIRGGIFYLDNLPLIN